MAVNRVLPGLERKPARVPLVALGLLVVGILVVSGFTMFTRSVVYYRTPTEVLADPGHRVRVSGTVVSGSIDSSPTSGSVAFLVTDGATRLKVVYSGVAPDTLKSGAQAVAEGSLRPDGIFHADVLFAKCPSKFQGKT
jgi:cytochrome c-type biogenesis protein CcmE